MKKKILLCFTMLLFSISIFNACKKESTKETDPDVDCTNVTANYNQHMKAIMDAKCCTCHSTGGEAEHHGIYTSYLAAKSEFPHCYEHAILEGEMPPSDAPQLTQAEKDLWVCWKKAGYPEN